MIGAVVGLVKRLMLAAALFWAILLVAFCAYTPQALEERHAAECSATVPQATVTIANQKLTVPAGPNTHIELDASDTSRTRIAWTRRSTDEVFVFCENDLAGRPDAKQVRVGEDVLRQVVGSGALSAFEDLHSVHFGTVNYPAIGDIPAPLPIAALNSDTFIAIDAGPVHTDEEIHITAGWLDPRIRVWTACREHLLTGHPTCRVGIIRASDSITVYLGNISPGAFPLTNERPSDDIMEAVAFLATILDHFRPVED